MTDDRWRERRHPDDFSEYGSLFDEAEPTQNLPPVSGDDEPAPRPPGDYSGLADLGDHGEVVGHDDGYDTAAAAPRAADGGASDDESDSISFDDASGPLPHWTEPPTGEVPRLDPSVAPASDDDDVDVWSSFSSESPVWKDDTPAPEPAPPESSGRHARVTGPNERVTGRHDRVSGQQRRVAASEAPPDPAPAPGRITIGTDPSGVTRREPVGSSRGAARRRGGPPPSPSSRARASQQPPTSSGRDMPTAIAVGLVLAAAFIAALLWKPWAVAALVAVILGLAAVEFYDKVAEKGYRPAVVPGIAACVATPLAAYWLGELAMPLALAFGFMAISGSFIGARSVEAGPLPNVSITTLGMVWIGWLGAFAMLILRLSTANGTDLPVSDNWGTDTLFLLALGVVANDIGALFVGSAAGRTPLRQWISPNKTVEGFIGGTLLTIIALVVVGIGEWSDTWTSYGDLLALAAVISVLAPMGDLVESMFKRNLDVKDFGTLVKGHGGILDRFDGFLFVLPGVYYLTLVLEPWAA
jgi:phosphatidate cytidylyltransferase